MSVKAPSDGSPRPSFSFSVQFGDSEPIAFEEVTGLEAETQAVEYRHGNRPRFDTIKAPGLAKIGNVTLEKGIVAKDHRFWAWYSQIKLNTFLRQTVVVRLLDESGAVSMSWALQNAWPTKVTSADLKSAGNQVALESIELAHEGLLVAKG